MRVLIAVICTVFFWLNCAMADQPRNEAKQKLIVGVPPNSAPLSFLDEERKGLLGLAVDLSSLIASSIGRDVVFVQTNARKLEQKLKSGEIDAIAGLLPVDLRNDFSDVLVTPLALNRAILVSGEDKQYTSETDLRGHRVLYVRGDVYRQRLMELGSEPVRADSITNALNSLLDGRADAYVTSSVEMAFHVIQSKNIKGIRVIGGSLERIPMVMMVSRKSGLLERMTGALVRLEDAGEVEKLRTKWLGRALSPMSFWEAYHHYIIIGTVILIFLAAVAIAWIVTLGRTVGRISQSLQRSEYKYRRFIEESPDIILILDDEGNVRMSNPAARKALSMGNGDDSSSVLMDALCSETSGCLDLFIELIPKKGSLQRELFLYPDTERECALEAKIFMADIDDSMISICLIGRDVTERLKMERQIMEMDRLAVLGKLAAGVAHEINNPVGIMMANAELAMEDCEQDSPMYQMLRAIYRNGERAVSTTRRLLNIALPGNVEFSRQNLAEVFADALSFLKPRLKNVAVETVFLPAKLEVMGSRVMLEQVALNLLINALDSMGGMPFCALVVEGRCRDGKVYIDVSDTGEGMDEERVKNIFEPFFTTKGPKGFGLGLYISHHIVDLHHGAIEAESSRGSGTTMSLCFKAA